MSLYTGVTNVQEWSNFWPILDLILHVQYVLIKVATVKISIHVEQVRTAVMVYK